MSFGRVALATALLVMAVLIQTVLLNRIPLPGASPDLVLLIVISLALVYGPLGGMLLGFAAGLLLDLVPPADGAIGRWALVMTVVGYAAGRSKEAVSRSAFLPLLVVAVLSAVSVVGYALLGGLISDDRFSWVALAHVLPAAVLYAVLLTPFVVPAVMALARRVEPAEFRYRM